MQTAKTEGQIANDRPLNSSISIRFFVHLTLSLLVLSGVGTLNEISLLSFLEVLNLEKTQSHAGILLHFSEIIKVQVEFH